jgi:hypothetical protein
MMANLVNLQGFDKQLAEAQRLAQKFEKSLNADLERKNWNVKQKTDLWDLQEAIIALTSALVHLAHNNRDGRG